MLRGGDPRDGRQRSGAGSQMQKISAGKFHNILSEMPVKRRHSALMLAARITLPHFSVSSAMSLPNSTAEPDNAVPPTSPRRALNLGSASAALISLLSLPMTSAGVPLGTPTPYQLLAS